VVLPEGERPASLHIRAGRIERVGDYAQSGSEPGGVPCDNLGDAVVLPGLIDPHVHVNEPGRTEWEGFATATRAAAAGGITLIADMPLNSTPVTTTAAALADKRDAALGQLTVDAAFHGGLVPGNAAELPALLDAGAACVKAFLCHSGLDDFPNATEADLRAAMPALAERGVPLLVHAEVVHGMDAEVPSPVVRYRDFVRTRPRRFEREAVERLIGLCRDTGARVHVVHLADAGCLPALAAARAEGLPITVETCPHYLRFVPEDIPDGAAAFKCAPPIRGDGPALLTALRQGGIDLVASDHSPCLPALKQTGDLATAWGGISSLQLGLGVVRSLAGVVPGGAEVEPVEIARWMSQRPAELLGLGHERGRIAPGCRADLAVADWDAAWRVDAHALQHRHPVTPYDGLELTGRVTRTYLAGQMVYDRGRFPAGPVGQAITEFRHARA